MEIEVRLVKKEDLTELSNIYVDVYSRLNIGENWTKESALRLLDYWFKKQQDLFFVAKVKNKLAGGFVAGIKPWWDGNHLVDGEIFVDFKHHKKGIGAELSRTMYKKAIRDYSVVAFDAVTYNNHKHPWSWYKKLGFEKIDNLFLFSGDVEKALKNLEKSRNE